MGHLSFPQTLLTCFHLKESAPVPSAWHALLIKSLHGYLFVIISHTSPPPNILVKEPFQPLTLSDLLP